MDTQQYADMYHDVTLTKDARFKGYVKSNPGKTRLHYVEIGMNLGMSPVNAAVYLHTVQKEEEEVIIKQEENNTYTSLVTWREVNQLLSNDDKDCWVSLLRKYIKHALPQVVVEEQPEHRGYKPDQINPSLMNKKLRDW